MNLRLCAALAAACLCTTSAYADPSYPLICHGGPGMKIMVNHDVPDGVHTGATHMTVFFHPAATPASPGPGECVWMDRTFRPGEPTNLWLSGDVEFAVQVNANGKVVRDSSGWRLNPEGSSPAAHDWATVVNGVLEGGTFTVQVYNSGGRTMVVTSVGP